MPAFPSLYGPIDRDLGHYRRYRRGSLGQAAEAAGLAVRKMHYLNTAGFFAWWANSHIFRRREQSAAQIAFFDAVVAPVMSRVEDVVAPAVRAVAVRGAGESVGLRCALRVSAVNAAPPP